MRNRTVAKLRYIVWLPNLTRKIPAKKSQLVDDLGAGRGSEMAKKSTLMTPDPYHTPGYCGYVPQFKYQIGETFGSHTHKLLTSQDPKVASSNNPVLSDTVPSLNLPPKTAEDFFNSPVYRRRTRSWGDQKYTPQMVPGYTGYIPKGLHHFGCRYAEICHYAISSFESDQQTNDDKYKELQTLRGYQSDPGSRESFTLAQNTTPLRPINPKARPYLPAYAKQHSISPFYMPDDHPQKYHMSGYTGFVPKARKYLGQSYPTITRYALQEQAAEGKRLDRTCNEPIKVFRPVEKVKTVVGIYPKDTGLVPHFTGHIPGQKFKYGTTFGSSTRNAVPEVSS